MAQPDELPDEIKRFIVTRCACYASPSEVATAVKADYDVAVTRQRVEAYDPTKVAGKALSAEFRALFEEARTQYLASEAEIGIAHKIFRLRTLERQLTKVETSGNVAMVLHILEAAAKECGGAFTNRFQHEHAGKDGGAIKTVTTTMTVKEAADAYASTLNDGS